MNERKTIQISDIFTRKNIEDALEIVSNSRNAGINKEIQDKIIDGLMDHINTVTGQENDPTYWAYALEYIARGVRLDPPFVKQ